MLFQRDNRRPTYAISSPPRTRCPMRLGEVDLTTMTQFGAESSERLPHPGRSGGMITRQRQNRELARIFNRLADQAAGDAKKAAYRELALQYEAEAKGH